MQCYIERILLDRMFAGSGRVFLAYKNDSLCGLIILVTVAYDRIIAKCAGDYFKTDYFYFADFQHVAVIFGKNQDS
jgi:hypothetical protein